MLNNVATNSSESVNSSYLKFQQTVLVIDKVDGQSFGDLGGIEELIELAKKSKIPIICICNNCQSKKIRSLANDCYDLRCPPPTNMEISKHLKEIGEKFELMMIDKNSICEVIDKFGNDIRQTFHFMQMWATKNKKNVLR